MYDGLRILPGGLRRPVPGHSPPDAIGHCDVGVGLSLRDPFRGGSEPVVSSWAVLSSGHRAKVRPKTTHTMRDSVGQRREALVARPSRSSTGWESGRGDGSRVPRGPRWSRGHAAVRGPCARGAYPFDVQTDGDRFVRDVLQNTGVIFVPGSGFGRSLDRAIRIWYGPLVHDLDRMEEGFRRVRDYLAGSSSAAR